MKLAVVGSREFSKIDEVPRLLSMLHAQRPLTKIITGGADGPDKQAEEWAKTNGVECVVHAADWSLGEGAGIKRNGTIIDESEALMAFWDGESAGTLDSICRASKKKLPMQVILA
jgi:hypothetical protein